MTGVGVRERKKEKNPEPSRHGYESIDATCKGDAADDWLGGIGRQRFNEPI
jgi:hypothetical protein